MLNVKNDRENLVIYLALFTAAFGGMMTLVIREYVKKHRQAREDAEMFA